MKGMVSALGLEFVWHSWLGMSISFVPPVLSTVRA